MNGGRDWRRSEAEQLDHEAVKLVEQTREDLVYNFTGQGGSAEDELSKVVESQGVEKKPSNSALIPKNYFLQAGQSEQWAEALPSVFPAGTSMPLEWTP